MGEIEEAKEVLAQEGYDPAFGARPLKRAVQRLIVDPLAIIQKIDPTTAWPGMRILLTSTTGEDALYCVLDEALLPEPAEMPPPA